MASGPKWNTHRGTYWVQWWDGEKWRRTTVSKRPAKWKPGDEPPKKGPPPEAMAARKHYDDLEKAARAAPRRSPEQTVAVFLEDYRRGYIGRQPGSALELEKASDVFLAWCKGRGVSRLSEVTTSLCHEWVRDRSATTAHRSGKPIARATVKKERGLLSGAWREAVRREIVALNPWAGAQLPGKPIKVRRGSWSPEQFEKLLPVCNFWLRDLLTIGCNTGLRIEALMGLEWRDIEWGKGDKGLGFVVVRPELDKTGRGYKVPITALCHEVLGRRFIHKDKHATHVLTGRSGAPIGSISHTDTAIRRACKRAELPKPDSPNHHMRRTFGRWAVQGHLTGKPIKLYTVSKWMGHASIKMTEEYLDMTEAESAQDMEQFAPGPGHSLLFPKAASGQEPEST